MEDHLHLWLTRLTNLRITLTPCSTNRQKVEQTAMAQAVLKQA
jgi:hypothetical protein